MTRSDHSAHRPVLLGEAVELILGDRQDLLGGGRPGIVVDATVGLGGHAERLLGEDPTLHLVGIDRDEQALAFAAERLAPFGDRATLVHGDYRNLDRHLDDLDLGEIDALLLDVGVSSMQLDRGERGFSFRVDAPLDMRMDRSRGPTAAEWLADAAEREIVDVLFRYGEERYARRIARAIVRGRERKPIGTTGRLADVVRRAVPGTARAERIDPATRTFQAIRIAINDELGALEQGLAVGFARLAVGGTLVAISFHSLEDRIVKRFLRDRAAACTCPPDLPECACGKRIEAEILTRRPITASEAEVADNPRARSAKLRAARKVA